MIDATFDIDALPTDWEALTSAGREMTEAADRQRWQLGDLGNKVQRVYGKASLKTFAGEINLPRHKTLYEYARVAAHYESSIRLDFPTLSWSHYQSALRAGDQAEHWLAQAADNGWPVAEMARQIAAAIGAHVPPRKLFDAEAVVLFAADCTLTLGLDADTPLGEGQKVRVVVYEWNTDLVTGTGRKVEVGA